MLFFVYAAQNLELPLPRRFAYSLKSDPQTDPLPEKLGRRQWVKEG